MFILPYITSFPAGPAKSRNPHAKSEIQHRPLQLWISTFSRTHFRQLKAMKGQAAKPKNQLDPAWGLQF